MGLAPEDEDLSHHPEELSGVCIRLLQPPGPGIDMNQGHFLLSYIKLCYICAGHDNIKRQYIQYRCIKLRE